MNMAKDMKNAKEWTREEDDALYQACVKHENCKYGENGFIKSVMNELKGGPVANRTKYAVKGRIYGKGYRFPSTLQRQTEAQVVDFDKVMEGVNKSAKEMIIFKNQWYVGVYLPRTHKGGEEPSSKDEPDSDKKGDDSKAASKADKKGGGK